MVVNHPLRPYLVSDGTCPSEHPSPEVQGAKKNSKKSDQLNQLKEYIERGFQNIPKRFHVLHSISKVYSISTS